MKRYGIIGYPLGHSFSPGYFNEKFKNEGIDARYDKYEIPVITDLQAILDYTPDLCGLNVTIPYKEKAMTYMDYVSPEARAIGAVNLINITRDGGKLRCEGYNTDVVGFMRSIKPLLAPHHRRALVLGTGGASKAVKYALHQLGLDTMLVSRRVLEGTLQYAQLTPDIMEQYTVVVNCTPAGMAPNFDQCPDLPYQLLTPRHLLYDLIYNPDETLFLKKGRAQGATTKNGLEMLLLQAEANWEIWGK